MAEFSVSRSTRVAAEPPRVHALVDDFREWRRWSPWEGVDPDLHREYAGPDRGVGARYAWRGNSKAGEGSMEITESDPTKVVVDLRFVKPFAATNVSRFDLIPAGETGTDVVWTMTGSRGPVASLLGRLFFDRVVGRDFERGLAALRQAAEH